MLDKFAQLNPLYQDLLASAIFLFLLWAGRKSLEILKSVTKDTKRQSDIEKIQKHWIHKYYVNTNGLYFFTQGYLFILTKAVQRILYAFLLITFYVGIRNIISGDFLTVVVAYLAFSIFWEANDWLDDHSSETRVKKIDQSLVKEVLDQLGNPRDKIDNPTPQSDTSIPLEKQKAKAATSKKKQ